MKEECRRKRQKLQRYSTDHTEISEVPPIVHEVLRSPGRPLDAETRAFFEPRFGHDFSQVRIRTDRRAAESAAAVNAEAYTVGSHVVFGAGRWRRDTANGVHLLAHELAHTIQQSDQSPALQKSLTVGRVDDPAERAADGVADAVLRSAPIPSLVASGPVIQRRRVERTPDKDVRIVWEDDGKTRYRVTRTHELKPHTENVWCPPEVTAGADQANIWLRLEWCRGTKGRIEVGADVPQELQKLIQDMADTISSGGNAADVIKNADLKPYVNVTITKSGSWQFGTGAHLTVGQQGVTGGGGQIELQKEGLGSIGLEGGSEQVGKQRDIRVGVTFKIPTEKVPKFDCPTREKVTIVEVVKLICAKEEYKPARDIPPPVKKVADTRKRYIYFLYAQDKVNHNLAGEGDLTAVNLDALRADFNDGYKVASITGFTSPEGPMQPRGRFEGNKALAKERAVAAKNLISETCKGSTLARWVTGQLPLIIPGVIPQPLNLLDPCFVGGADSVVAHGCDEGPAPSCTGGELHTKVVGNKEVEGKPLAVHAVPEFESAPEEAPQMTSELTKQLEQKRTPEEKAELVYPKLRRAEIVLVGEKTVTVGEPRHEEGGFKPSDTPCPANVAKVAFPDAEDIMRDPVLGKCPTKK
jgi:hypothetical protein